MRYAAVCEKEIAGGKAKRAFDRSRFFSHTLRVPTTPFALAAVLILPCPLPHNGHNRGLCGVRTSGQVVARDGCVWHRLSGENEGMSGAGHLPQHTRLSPVVFIYVSLMTDQWGFISGFNLPLLF